jgi:bile acid:Na+ symporter, BASS family
MIEMSGLARACTYLFLVSMMLSIGLEVTGRQMLDSLRNTSLVGRALLANLVLVPLLGLFLVRGLAVSAR